ncbi:MAG: 50S ribosome-binding GTPase [Candidatus Heimdallarchaeota archaeon]|nr:MAG: 50S ribosome-binding GTPase [Candidatus Heimdallarchaeota archaeon]
MSRRKEHRQVFGLIRNSDIVLEVIDGRLPTLSRVSTIERHLEKLRIPLIIVLNKCDLVPRHICDRTKRIFDQEYPTVYISARNRQGTKILRKKIVQLSRKKQEILVSIVGIPNTGKSSLLNIMRGKHVSPTGQKPGVTRHLQIVRVSKKILMYDTPGVIPFDHPNKELQVFMGAISIEKLEDPLKTSFFFLDRIRNHYSEGFMQRYNLSSLSLDNETIIAHIAQQRGMILKGAQPNITEAAKVLMRELTAGLFPYWEEIAENAKLNIE